MIYYIRASNLWAIEDIPYKILFGVSSNLSGRGSMKINEWASNYLIEADEGLDTFLMLRWGIGLAPFDTEELKTLYRDKVIFFSKERTRQLREKLILSPS